MAELTNDELKRLVDKLQADLRDEKIRSKADQARKEEETRDLFFRAILSGMAGSWDFSIQSKTILNHTTGIYRRDETPAMAVALAADRLTDAVMQVREQRQAKQSPNHVYPKPKESIPTEMTR